MTVLIDEESRAIDSLCFVGDTADMWWGLIYAVERHLEYPGGDEFYAEEIGLEFSWRRLSKWEWRTTISSGTRWVSLTDTRRGDEITFSIYASSAKDADWVRMMLALILPPPEN